MKLCTRSKDSFILTFCYYDTEDWHCYAVQDIQPLVPVMVLFVIIHNWYSEIKAKYSRKLQPKY